jgi:hypothetical protein|nr:MAG TPA: DNA gyrase subunit A [Caudoviricetes sp.]DAS83280.1 MAG TPA: DNA gyrase subunit A [Caudoviricetes sp.]
MSKKDLRTCCICGKKYSFCPVCNAEDRNKKSWYFTFCSENCHDIYEITSAFEDKRISDIEAKNKLTKLDLSKKNNFSDSYKKSITSIMNAKVQTKKTISKKENSGNVSVNKEIIAKAEKEAKSNVE